MVINGVRDGSGPPRVGHGFFSAYFPPTHLTPSSLCLNGNMNYCTLNVETSFKTSTLIKPKAYAKPFKCVRLYNLT